ncbi:MAG: hypothetical protein FWC32_03795 [Firmicutes bacterium]|nr:hypothetical protein [Bacillota bacterium]
MEMSVFKHNNNVLLKEFFAETPEKYQGFWQILRDRYPGWEVDLVYRNCEPPTDFIEEIGANVLESHIITCLAKEDFTPANDIDAIAITAENFDIFAAVHSRVNPDMGWSSKDILEDLSRWQIYMHGNSYVLMSLWSREASEIFALEVPNDEIGMSLLSMAAKFAFDIGKSKVDYFINDDCISHLEFAQKLGFKTCGKSIAYRVEVLE